MTEPREPGQRKEYHFKLFKTPKETVVAVSMASMKKSELRLDVLCVLSFLAGVWVALGGVVMITVAGGVPNVDPGVRKLLGGLVFPVALMLVTTAGAELFTGNVMIFTVGVVDRKASFISLARNWLVSWTFNFIGSVAAAGLLAYLTNFFATQPWLGYVQGISVDKVKSGWGVQVLRGVGANIFVCFATLISIASEDITSKLLSCFFFIGSFVVVGFEHSIANMSILSCGLMYGAPVSVGAMIGSNIIPVTIGNIIGGVFLGLGQWFCFVFVWPSRAVPVASSSIVQRLVLGETKQTPSTRGIETAWVESSICIGYTTKKSKSQVK